MTISKKTIALLMALVLVLGVGVGGTIAWLSTKTATVTNTFTVGDIGTLTLTESTNISVTEGSNDVTNPDKYIIVPGVDITKDPQVAYNAADDTIEDVAVYVFVKVEGGTGWTVSGSNFDYKVDNTALVSFTVDSGWTALTGKPGVYYKELAAKTSLAATSVIKDNKITVSKDITKEQLTALATGTNGMSVLDLKFTAYAIQKSGFTSVGDAWTAVSSASTTNTTTP